MSDADRPLSPREQAAQAKIAELHVEAKQFFFDNLEKFPYNTTGRDAVEDVRIYLNVDLHMITNAKTILNFVSGVAALFSRIHPEKTPKTIRFRVPGVSLKEFRTNLGIILVHIFGLLQWVSDACDTPEMKALFAYKEPAKKNKKRKNPAS